jgi:hypothetical protein
MKIAVMMSDGYGGDYRSALNADIAVVEIPQGLLTLGGIAVDATKAAAESGGFQVDEIRFLLPFRVFEEISLTEDEEGNSKPPFEEDWRDEGFIVLPDDWEPPKEAEEGRVECCSIAFDARMLQLHCLPKHGEGWLRSYSFWVDGRESNGTLLC